MKTLILYTSVLFLWIKHHFLQQVSHGNVLEWEMLFQACEFLDVYEKDGPSGLEVYKTDDLEWEEVKYITHHERDNQPIEGQLIEAGNYITLFLFPSDIL